MRLLLLTACAACVEHGSVLPPLEAGPPPPQPRGTVSIRVVTAKGAAANLAVFFQDPTSNLVSVLATNFAGFATEEQMVAGGFVTVVNPFGQKDGVDDLRTFAGVQPGDELRLIEPSATPTDVDVTAPLDAAAAQYQVHTACGAGNLAPATRTGTLALRDCAVTDMLLETFTAAGAPSKALLAPNVEISPGAILTLQGAYVTVPTITFDAPDVDPRFTALHGSARIYTQHGRITERTLDMPVKSSAATGTVRLPIFADATFAAVLRPAPVPPLIEHTVIEWGQPGARQPLDLMRTTLPEYTTAPQFLTPRHVAWSQAPQRASGPDAPNPIEASTPGNPSPQLVVVDVHVERGSAKWNWSMVAPFTGPFVSYPELIEPIASFNERPGDVATVTGLMTLASDVPRDQLRPTALLTNGLDPAIARTVSGRIVVEQLAGKPVRAPIP